MSVFCTFWLSNVLFATAAYNYSTAERPKVLRRLQFFNILTGKCRFSPQRRAIFRHLHFQKWSKHESCFAHFDLNMCFSAPGNFSTVERQKGVRRLQFFYILTFKCAFRHSGVQLFDSRTSKSGPGPSVFQHFDWQMCFSPQRRTIFRHLHFQKWSKHVMFCTFWLEYVLFGARQFFDSQNVKKWSEDYSFLTFWLSNVHFATAACNFSTFKQTKVVRTCGALYILTGKCAFHHSGVHFFEHLNFKKWSRIVSFLTFSLPNVLFATAAYNFATSELPKVDPHCGVLRIFTSECAFRHSGVQFLMSPLSTYLRTRRFNRPTFGLTRHTNLWKNTAFRDFSNIWRGCIFFSSNFLTIASSVDWLDYSTTAFQLSILSEVSI